MLGKLFKYEFKSTARTFGPLYLGLLLLSVMARIFIHNLDVAFSESWVLKLLEVISVTLYSFMIFGTIASLFAVSVKHFQKNLLGQEGYLMLTLPVNSWQLILSKMITMAVWALFSMFLIMLSAFIISGEDIIFLFSEFFHMLDIVTSAVGFLGTLEIVALLLILLLGFPLPFYASISIGGLWRKHPKIGFFGAFIGFTALGQYTAGLMFRSLIERGQYFYNAFDYMSATAKQILVFERQAFQYFIVPITLYFLATALVFFFITQYILDNKLDLE